MRFFSADPHFGHRRICELAARPFTDVTTMNEILVANWNSVVSPDDEAWILGDIALGPIMESLEYIGRLNGTKHMVWGNHDRCFPGSKKSAGMTPEEWVGVYKAAGFTSVRADGGLMPFIPDYRFVNLSHFPYIGDSHDSNDRWGEYRLKDYGTTILHGHTHSKKKISRSSRGTLQVNVGVDAWSFFPVSEVAILALIEAES